MIFKILIALAALTGVITLFTIREKYSFMVTLVLALSIIFIFIPIPTIRQIGSYLLPLGVLASLVYGIFKSNLNKKTRIIILLITIPAAISQLDFMLDFPVSPIPGLLMFIPIGTIVYMLISGIKEYKTQIGFLSIILSYDISRIAVLVQHGY